MSILDFVRRIINKRKFNLSRIGRKVSISSSKFEGNNSLADNVIVNNCYLGAFSYINSNSHFYNTYIGRYCSIADNVNIIIGNHPKEFATTHPSFYYNTTNQIGYTIHKGEPLYNLIKKYPKGEAIYQVIIGNDVWIGSHVLILEGVTIGDGAVIAAGSVVVKDVAPYSIVGGNPAKLIKMRFPQEIVRQLLVLRWWEKPIDWIKNNYRLYTNPEELILNSKI